MEQNMKRLVIFYCSLLSSMSCFSEVTGTWPIVDDIEVNVRSESASEIYYNITFYRHTLTDEESQLRPNQILGDANPRLALVHRHNITEVPYPEAQANFLLGDDDKSLLTLKITDSWGDIVKKVGEYYPPGSSIRRVWNHTGGSVYNECAMIAIGSGGMNLGAWDTIFASITSRVPPRVNGNAYSCILTPQPDRWCALKTPALEFDFGDVKLTDIDDVSRTDIVDVNCNDTDVTFLLKLKGLDYIPLSNGMRANISVNDSDLSKPIVGQSGLNQLEVKATLSGEPEFFGEFSGNGVLYVSYP